MLLLAIAFSPLVDWVGLPRTAPALLLPDFDFAVFFFAAMVHSPLANLLGKIKLCSMTPPDKNRHAIRHGDRQGWVNRLTGNEHVPCAYNFR
jgi:hypothetical protein